MTIAIAIQVNEGVVLASDSAMTLSDPAKTGPESVLNVYNTGNKIFNLRKGLPIGAVFYGMGSMGVSSISTLAKDLRRRFSGDDPASANWTIDPGAFTIEEIATKAREFFFDEQFTALNMPATPGVQFAMMIAGYSSGANLSEVWIYGIENGTCAAPVALLPQGVSNWYAGGDPEAVIRLANGHGVGLAGLLPSIGIAAAAVPAAMAAIEKQLGIALVEPPMPIQDAIDLAEFFVTMTAGYSRFKHGAATVGGPVESAAITKHEGFKWVKRKHYFSDTLNPREDA